MGRRHCQLFPCLWSHIMTMQLAFYKGRDYFADRLIQWWTNGPYSHCELVIDGTCYSASTYEGCVRSKQIDLASGRWDVIAVEGDESVALAWFAEHKGAGYDYWGLAGFVLPWRMGSRKKRFCSEACAEMLSMQESWKISPNNLAKAKQPG
jgi:hypothetical protein